MIVSSMALVLVGLVALLLGVFGIGEEPLLFVYGSIGACLLAAVLLVVGVLRARPSRTPVIVDDPRSPTWSGAALPEPAPARERGGAGTPPGHVQVLSAREAARDSVATTSTTPLDLERVRAAAGGEEDDAAEQARFAGALEGLDLDTARIERLRGRFVTADRLASAAVDELVEVPGISRAMAERIAARVRSPR